MSRSILAGYCNQSVTLKSSGAVDAYNIAATTSSTISVRLQYKRKIVRNSRGESVVSESQIFTTAAVAPNDFITIGGVDRPVIAVEIAAGLNGAEEWREVYL